MTLEEIQEKATKRFDELKPQITKLVTSLEELDDDIRTAIIRVAVYTIVRLTTKEPVEAYGILDWVKFRMLFDELQLRVYGPAIFRKQEGVE